MEESSLEDPTIASDAPGPTNAPVTYQIVEDGTKRRCAKLIDSLGYCYNVKESEEATTYWQCTVRPQGNYCKAMIKQTAGEFTKGRCNHQPETGALVAVQIATSVKKKAMDNLF